MARTCPHDRGRTTDARAAARIWSERAGGFDAHTRQPEDHRVYAGLLPTFIDLEKLTAGEMAVMMLITLPVVGGILTAYAFGATRARRLLSPPRLQLMNRTAATMMIG